ncbi:MAG: dihydroneopterin aldolase [Pseudomonadota bacterium]
MSEDVIIIDGLRFDAVIGIHPHERTTPQPVCVDLELRTDIAPAARSGEIDDAIDYAAVAADVTEFVQVARARLIEPLIEQLATRLLEDSRIQSVQIKLTKPIALDAAAAVGVEIERQRATR